MAREHFRVVRLGEALGIRVDVCEHHNMEDETGQEVHADGAEHQHALHNHIVQFVCGDGIGMLDILEDDADGCKETVLQQEYNRSLADFRKFARIGREL